MGNLSGRKFGRLTVVRKDEVPAEDKPCDYCSEDYVIPRVFDGGITAWENIDAKYCPVCGRKREK